MCLSVLQQTKKFRCLEWLDKLDKNMEPIVLISWSLVNSFGFNLCRFQEHIFHDSLFILWCCRRGYDFDLRLDMLFPEFHTIKLLWTLLLLIKILFCIIFQYYSFFDNREMCLSVLQQAKKFRCLEWLDKIDKNMKPWVLIWWSLVNSFCFNLCRFWKHIFHD
jgi:hypothetical protein